MSHTSEVVAQALGLPRDQRAEIAHELLPSLDAPPEGGVDQAWLTEVRRRQADVDRGAAILEEWESVRERIASRLRRL